MSFINILIYFNHFVNFNCMKKSKILMLLSGFIMMFAALAFTSCVDDNDDVGMPYLEVTPQVLKFDTDGKAIGASEFVIKTNRPWTLVIPDDAQWVRPSATSGNGDGKVSFNLFASSVGQSAELTFALKNSAGFVYMDKKVTIEQGDAPQVGPIGKLVAWIKEKNPAAGDLNYPVETIEAVILANNEYGNNFGKLYVGDNTTLPNSGMILYSTTDFNKSNSAKFPVGKKVTLDMRNAEYAPYQNLRELKGVVVTVSDEDPVTVVYPTISAAQLNSDNYQGQYVKVNSVTPQASYVGQAWATSAKRAVKMDANGDAEVQSYMTTATDAPDFASMTIANKTGAIYGAAERIGATIQIIPTKPEDVMEISEGGDEPAVTTGSASALSTTGATLAGSSRNIDNATEVGVEYLLFAEQSDWSRATKKVASAVSSSWEVEVTDLTEGTKYAYRAYAVTSSSTIYGAVADFTTKSTSAGDIFVDFTDLNNYPSGFPKAKGTGTLATYKFGGYDFTFLGAVQSDGSGGYYSSTYEGATALLWGKKSAYIGFPAVADKALTKVVCIVPEGASGAVQVGVFDANDQPVNGGEVITWTKSGAGYRTYTYTLSGTAVNTSYRLYINSAQNSQLAQLELYYGEGGGSVETPTLTPSTASMEFPAEADAVGKTQEYTIANATGLTLYADVADKTNFSAAVENTNTVRVKTLNANEGEAPRTTTVTVYLSDSPTGEKKATATINVSQASPAPSTATPIADVIAGGADKDVFVQGQIVGTHKSGFIVKDNTGILYVYTGKAPAYGVGDTVSVSGKTALYGNLIQLGTDSVVTLVSEGSYTQPTPETMDGAAFDAYVNGTPPLAIKYVQYTGTLDISGSYYNVTVDGTTVKGSLSYVPDGLVNTALNGQPIIVKGYTIGTPNTNKNYLNTLAIEVTAASSDPVILDVTPASLDWAFNATNTQTAEVSLLNAQASALSLSGDYAPFTASLSGTTITVTPPQTPNTTGADIVKILTVSVAGGNSKTLTLKQEKSGEATVILKEDFAGITEGNNTESTGSNAAWNGNENFPIVETAYQAGGAVKIGKSKGTGSITSKALDLSAPFTVVLKVKGWTNVEGKIVVTVGSESKEISYTAKMGDAFEEVSVSFPAATSSSTVKIATSAKRAFIDEVVIEK